MLKKIASNTLSQVFSKVTTALIAILLINMLTNYLSLELFGTYSKVYNYIYIFSFLADLGLYTLTIKEITKDKKNAEYIFGNILTLRILSGIFIILSSMSIAYLLPEYNSFLVFYSIIILGFFAFFSLLNSSMLSLMQSYMKVEFSFISIVSAKILTLLITFLVINFWFPDPKQTGYFLPFLLIIGAGLIGIIWNTGLNFWYARKIIPIRLRFDFKFIKQMFYKSLPYGIALFLSVVYAKIDIFLLGRLEAPEIAERSIALYNLPIKIMDVFMVIGAFLMNALLPSMTNYFNNNQIQKLKDLSENTFRVMLIVSVGIIATGVVYKDYVVQIIANEDYLQTTAINHFTASHAFDIVLYMLLFFYLGLVFSYVLIASGKQNQLLKISIIVTIINIIGNIILIPKLSFLGAGIMTIITQALFLGLAYYFSRDIFRFRFPFGYICIVIGAGYLVYFLNLELLQHIAFGNFLDLGYGTILFLVYAGVFGFYELKKSGGLNILSKK